MRIKEIAIKDFKSILESKIKLDSASTTFIGANESGKTNVLLALQSLDINCNYTVNDLCTFSVSWNEFKNDLIKESEIEPTNVLFELERDDQIRLKEIDPKLKSITTLRCIKKFDNTYYLDTDDIDLETVANEEKKALIEEFIRKTENILINFYKKHVDNLNNPDPSSDKELVYQELTKNILKILETGYEDYFLIDEYNKLKNFTPSSTNTNIVKNWKNIFQNLIDKIEGYKVDIKGLNDNDFYLFDKLYRVLPNFEYFSDYELLEDRYDFDEFKQNIADYPILKKLIEFTGLNIENLDSNVNHIRQDLDHASNILTDSFNEFWDQDDIFFNFDYINNEIAISVKDSLINISQPMSMRSEGLQAVISLFINVMATPENSILLLDDPGVHLHASGQKDILKLLNNLSKTRQIIISTHSPFLLERRNLERIRIVSKDDVNGTRINEKFHISDYDAFEPIRASIGMTLSDSLFTTDKNILVEGISDLFIFEAMNRLLEDGQKDYIDTSKITIFPVNGADKMPYYTTFLMKDKSDFVVILDHDKKGKNVSKTLVNKFNVKQDDIIKLDKVSGCDPDKICVIEDLIDIDFYIKAVNRAYSNIFTNKKLDLIKVEDLSERSLNGILSFFKQDQRGGFDKTLVAKELYIMVQRKDYSPNDNTISNFSDLFKIINEKLN